MEVTRFYNDIPAVLNPVDVVCAIPPGKGSAITSDRIALVLGCESSKTQVHIRKIIKQLIDDGHLIGSCKKGYFRIETREEFREYIENLESRKTGIQNRINALYDNWNTNKQTRLF